MPDGARLIALDWGSTRLRGWLLGEGGVVLAERESEAGASRLSGGAAAFEAALHALAGDWLAQEPAGLPLLACGMVGSAHGWCEAPYVPCPADLGRLHTLCQRVPVEGRSLHIVPGLIDAPAQGTPDVMRGEETQLAGLLALQPALAAAATVLMPGTHNKWVDLQEGRVLGFRTRMTGEMYAVLRQHSVLGRLMPPGETAWHAGAFDAGIAAARSAQGRDLAGQLFAVRTLGLTGRWPGEALPDYLSGLLIGHELIAALRPSLPSLPSLPPLALVGDPLLCRRYQHALRLFGVEPAVVLGNTAVSGLWHIAQAALLQPTVRAAA